VPESGAVTELLFNVALDSLDIKLQMYCTSSWHIRSEVFLHVFFEGSNFLSEENNVIIFGPLLTNSFYAVTTNHFSVSSKSVRKRA